MTTLITIPTNPVDLKKIKDAVNEACNCHTRIEAEKECIKDIIEMVTEEFEIPKSYVSKLIRAQHKADFDKVATEFDDLSALIEAVQNA